MPKILAIDDKQDNLVTISALLRNLIPDCTVITSDSGAEGIKKAEAEQPDTILLDIKMPEMDGFEVCRHLKSNEETKHIPVIMVTAIRTDSQSRVKGLEIGADAFLSKPIDEIELVAQIKVMLRIKKAEDILRKEKDLLEDAVRERTRALRESEEKYRLMFETMVSGFALLEMMYDESGKPMDCRYLDVNPAHEKLTGLKTSEIIGRTARESIPGLEDSWIENYGQVDRTGKPMEVENYVEGLKSWYKVFAYRTKPGFIAVTFENITDRKRVEETLKESETKHKEMIANISDVIAIMDSSGIIRYKSPNIEKWFGWHPEDLVGTDGWETVHPDDLEGIQKEFLTLLEQYKSTKTVTYRYKCKNGNYKWIELTAVNLVKDAIVNGVLMNYHDITERNRAEEALRESEEQYRTLMDSLPVAVYRNTPGPEGKFLMANLAFCKMFGFKNEEEVKDFTPASLYQDPKERKEYSDNLIQKEVLKNDERTLLKRDGTPVNTSITASVGYGKDGEVSHFDSIMLDITETRRLQAQLQQAQKMEAMGTLAGGIAHDFNNLLMAIQGRAAIMLMNKDSSHPDIKHLKGIEDNIESAADLTNQLLGFARGGKYEVRPTDLNELIKKQNRMFGRTKKEITIRGKYEENPWPVEVDRGQIEQVLLNLYVNAWQAMPGGGNLYLETENVTLDEHYVKPFSIEPGRYVKISVTDTGVGMDKAIQEKIFEPFFTTKEMDRGTGLGLASVYGIIKNHGGFINVYSEKGHGSAFNIFLPASEEEVIEEKKSAGDTLRGTETVLFVDDEDMIIEIAEELFERLGYKVLTARSGKEAIGIYEENKERIDIVLLDMIMPDMSGSDTYDRMKDIDPKVKVLLSSGYSINGQATEIMDRGCDGFIQKPFKTEELSQKLREILDER